MGDNLDKSCLEYKLQGYEARNDRHCTLKDRHSKGFKKSSPCLKAPLNLMIVNGAFLSARPHIRNLPASPTRGILRLTHPYHPHPNPSKISPPITHPVLSPTKFVYLTTAYPPYRLFALGKRSLCPTSPHPIFLDSIVLGIDVVQVADLYHFA